MNAGELDQQITIQIASRNRDNIGNEIIIWQTWRTAWANVQTTGGNETFYSAQVLTEATHKIKMRYTSRVVATMRILWKGRTLEITYVDSSRQRKGELYLICKEVVIR